MSEISIQMLTLESDSEEFFSFYWSEADIPPLLAEKVNEAVDVVEEDDYDKIAAMPLKAALRYVNKKYGVKVHVLEVPVEGKIEDEQPRLQCIQGGKA